MSIYVNDGSFQEEWDKYVQDCVPIARLTGPCEQDRAKSSITHIYNEMNTYFKNNSRKDENGAVIPWENMSTEPEVFFCESPWQADMLIKALNSGILKKLYPTARFPVLGEQKDIPMIEYRSGSLKKLNPAKKSPKLPQYSEFKNGLYKLANEVGNIYSMTAFDYINRIYNQKNLGKAIIDGERPDLNFKPMFKAFCKTVNRFARQFGGKPVEYEIQLKHLKKMFSDEYADIEYTVMYGSYEIFWLAYFTFQIDGVKKTTLKKNEIDQIKTWVDYTYSCGWTWPFKDICIVADRPKSLNYDLEQRLHSPAQNGKLLTQAISFSDGFDIYAWEGILVMLDGILSPEIALNWSNMDQRRAFCEIIGWDKILEILEHKVVDADPNPSIGTLYDVKMPDAGRIKMLRVNEFPDGSGRNFALLVGNECKTAAEAKLASFGLPNRPELLPMVES